MPIFEVLQPLDHDGKSYKEGKTVELTQEQAEPLLELKAIAPVGAPTKTDAPIGSPEVEDTMIVTQQVSGDKPRDVDPKKAPPSSARVQQQRGAKESE